MCGINGFSFPDGALLDRMNRCLSHRGPDFAGAYVDGRVSLGHTLLAIRDDPGRSRQPVHDEGSPWVLLFNGQLYNNERLKSVYLDERWRREELDTRVLYQLILKKGWDFIGPIQGMFAIALWNRDEGILRLYRDATGQKTLYYYFKNGKFIFSSEIKGILAHPDVDREPDPEALSVAVRVGYVPGPKTLFRHIRKLNLSECVTYRPESGSLSNTLYSSDADGLFEGIPEDHPELVLQRVVVDHLQSKARLSMNLSGGLDSSLLLHEARGSGVMAQTYTTSFLVEGKRWNDDASIAEKFARDHDTRHREITITQSDYLEHFVEAYRTVEEPNYNISLPAYLIMAKAQGIRGDGNRVILSGDGGDELFGGYPYYGLNRRIDRLRRLLTPPLHDFLKNWRNGTDIDFGDPCERWFFFRDFRAGYLRSDAGFDVKSYLKLVADEYLRRYASRPDSMLGTMLMDRLLWQGGENLIRNDKLFMSQSVEVRSPLTYHPLRVHFDRRLKASDYQDGTTTKSFLRKTYANRLPGYVASKAKTGWRAPLKEWYDTEMKDLFVQILTDPKGKGDRIDWKGVKSLVESSDEWPGKKAHLYLSLAILAREYGWSL